MAILDQSQQLDISAKVGKLLLPKKLTQNAEHPWVEYLKGGLDRKQRRVSRESLVEISTLPSQEELVSIVAQAVKDLPGMIEGKVSEIPASATKVMSREAYDALKTNGASTGEPVVLICSPMEMSALIEENIKQTDDVIALIAPIPSNGKWRIGSAGDHLRADGNFHMQITASIVESAGAGAVQKEIEYVDKEKVVIARDVRENELKYQDVLSKITAALAQEYGREIGVAFPAQVQIQGKERMLPLFFTVKGIETPTELQDLVRKRKESLPGVLESGERNPQKTLVDWMRLRGKKDSMPGRIAQLLQQLPLGKNVSEYLLGDVLFSVMDADVPFASTTISGKPELLVVTVIREKEKPRNVLSVSVSGNEKYWPKERLRSVLDKIDKNT